MSGMPPDANMFYDPAEIGVGGAPQQLSYGPRVRPSVEVRHHAAKVTLEATLVAQVLARRPAGPAQIRQAARDVVAEFVRDNPQARVQSVISTVLAERRPQIVATALRAAQKPPLCWGPPAYLAPGNWRG